MTHRLDVACSRELAARWCALAERRLDHLTEMFDSGRWRRYYTEQSLLDDIRHAKAAVQAWKDLAVAEPEQVSLVPRLRPASAVPLPAASLRLTAPTLIEHRPIAHAPIELPPSLETVLAESEIILAADIEPATIDIDADLLADEEVVPELAGAAPRIDMAALEQVLSIGIDADADEDEPLVDLDAIERRYPALAVAY